MSYGDNTHGDEISGKLKFHSKIGNSIHHRCDAAPAGGQALMHRLQKQVLDRGSAVQIAVSVCKSQIHVAGYQDGRLGLEHHFGEGVYLADAAQGGSIGNDNETPLLTVFGAWGIHGGAEHFGELIPGDGLFRIVPDAPSVENFLKHAEFLLFSSGFGYITTPHSMQASGKKLTRGPESIRLNLLWQKGKVRRMKREKVSSAVIRRLPRYYRHLTDLTLAGVVRISSNTLGKAMNLTASQIRQDLSCFGEFGQQGYGYNVESLRNAVSEILGMDQKHTAIILGVGNLGRALMENFHFSHSGFVLTAAFDVNPSLVGKSLAGVPVYSVEHLNSYLQSTPTSVGVLTVPRTAAAPMADRLVAGGVRGIWNFTNAELNVHKSGVVVENVHFADSLLALSYMISEAP